MTTDKNAAKTDDKAKDESGTTSTTTESKASGKSGGKAKKAAASPTVDLPKGKGTQKTKAPASNPEPLERGGKDAKDEDESKDTLRLQADKARWEYGQKDGELADMLREQREITESQR